MSLFVSIRKKVGLFDLNVSFETTEQVLGILGASGCGKSMTLQCIAGILTPDEGRIVLNGVPLFDSERRINLPPQKRRVGYLFQNYALFPNMTVEQNICCGLRERKSRKQKKALVSEILGTMMLSGIEDRFPHQLSGGQQQRVALARILVNQPELLLLDEPFCALDDYLKVRLETEMRSLLREFGKDTVLVSHSRDEVYRLGRELAIMDRGKVIGFGGVKQMFSNPGTRQGAILTGCKNIVPARKRGLYEVEIPEWGMCFQTAEIVRDDIAAIGIRAHDFSPAELKNSGTIHIIEEIEEPFEVIRKFSYQTAAAGSTPLWWRMSKEKAAEFPDRLGVLPEHIMMFSS